uniref:GDSL esterase/lipase n=1 Tax=Triticum urartu TaxID=4572 RepID=A0A8R7UNX8_TRIUA
MTQLGWFDAHFKARRASGGGKDGGVGDALFWVGEIGANDYGYNFMAPDALPSERIRSMAIDRITTFLEGLLNRGARYVVVQGMPLTGCLPLTMTLSRSGDRDNLSCVASVNQQSLDHNHHLQAALHRLRRSHPDAIIAYADYHAAHLAVVRSPARYGFAEPFKACCGTGGGAYNFEIFATCGSPEVATACAQPARYVNWDGVHMTEAMYKVVAGMFFHDATGAYCRPTFGSLLAARKDQGK